jgi:hypothetical protein
MSETILLLPLYGFLGRTGTTFPASLDIKSVLKGGEKLRINAEKIRFSDEIRKRHTPNAIQTRNLWSQQAPFTDSRFELRESLFIEIILFRMCVCPYQDTTI